MKDIFKEMIKEMTTNKLTKNDDISYQEEKDDEEMIILPSNESPIYTQTKNKQMEEAA